MTPHRPHQLHEAPPRRGRQAWRHLVLAALAGGLAAVIVLLLVGVRG